MVVLAEVRAVPVALAAVLVALAAVPVVLGVAPLGRDWGVQLALQED